MQPVSQALEQVKELYHKVLGQPAPELAPGSYVPFPPGVDPLEHAVKEVDELKRLAEGTAFAPRPFAWMPAVDSYTTAEGLLLRMEVPGVDRSTLKVLVGGGECIVRGERKPPQATAEMRPLGIERMWGAFERRFALPAGSQPGRVTARYADGELEINVTVERLAEPKPMNVEVVS